MAIESVYLCKHLVHPTGTLTSCDVQELARGSEEAANLVKLDYYEISTKKCPVCHPTKVERKVEEAPVPKVKAASKKK